MSDYTMDFLDPIGREGPCFHCGIDHTPLWRSGPPEKPALCDACGSRWRTRGILEDYIPKHEAKDAQGSQSSKFFSELNPNSSTPNPELEEPKFGSNVVGHDQSSVFLGEATNYGSSTAYEATEPPLWDPNNVSKQKRSVLEQRVLSPTERLHQQLYSALQDSEFTKQTKDNEDEDNDDEEDVLILEPINSCIPEKEFGIGCKLLKKSLSPTKGSISESSSMLKSSTSRSKESKSKSSIRDIKPAEFPPLFQFLAARDSKLIYIARDSNILA